MAFEPYNLINENVSFLFNHVQVHLQWFRAVEYTAPLLGVTRHKHTSYEFQYLLEGTIRIVLDDRSLLLHPGELYITRPGCFHSHERVDGKPIRLYALGCDITLLEGSSQEEQLIERLFQLPPAPISDDGGIKPLFEEAFSVVKGRMFGYRQDLCALITRILIGFARGLRPSYVNESSSSALQSKYDQVMAQIKDYTMSHLNVPITTKALAEEIHLSQKQLCRIIQRKTGMSTKEYLNHIKMDQAKDLLHDSSLNIKEIANLLGFSTEQYFNRFFKRYESYPPGYYRQAVWKVPKQ